MLRHLRNYASAGVFSALAGLVSFPVLTRNLSVAEYGALGLVTASLTLCIAIGKLGVQHALIRYFAQVRNGNIAFSIGQLNSTVSTMFFALASGATLLWLFCGAYLLPLVLQYENITTLFLLASGIVFIRLLGSGVLNFLRAQQRSGEVASAQSLSKLVHLSLILIVLLLADLDPWRVIACLLLAESVAVLYAARQYWPDFRWRIGEISGKLARAMLIYGMPLMILESLGLVLRLSDRYLIEAMLGVEALGQYSASYNLTAYLDLILLAALMQAFKPAYMQVWESQGSESTRQFLSTGFRLYMVLGIPFIAIFSMTSPHLLGILAGEKYSPGTAVIPFVAISFWLEGAMQFLAAGLYIYKNTRVLMIWSLVATLINLTLNVLLIPRFGIIGAALVTIVSYAVFMIGVTANAFRHVAFSIAFKVPFLLLLASVLVFLLATPVDIGTDTANFLVKGAVATPLLLGLVWMLDSDTHRWMNEMLFSRLKRA